MEEIAKNDRRRQTLKSCFSKRSGVTIGNRSFFSPDVENQLIMHSRVHYMNKRWDFGGGLTFSWIYAQIPENGTHIHLLRLDRSLSDLMKCP